MHRPLQPRLRLRLVDRPLEFSPARSSTVRAAVRRRVPGFLKGPRLYMLGRQTKTKHEMIEYVLGKGPQRYIIAGVSGTAARTGPL